MFQPFRLVVNLVPRVVEEIMQETLQQTVMTKNLQSAHLPGCSQAAAVVLLVLHKRRLLCRQLLEHSSDGSRTDPKMLSDGVAGHSFLFGAAQLQYRFQIVVYPFGVVGASRSRSLTVAAPFGKAHVYHCII